MPRGGRRAGAGRPRGSTTKRTLAAEDVEALGKAIARCILDELAQAGVVPTLADEPDDDGTAHEEGDELDREPGRQPSAWGLPVAGESSTPAPWAATGSHAPVAAPPPAPNGRANGEAAPLTSGATVAWDERINKWAVLDSRGNIHGYRRQQHDALTFAQTLP